MRPPASSRHLGALLAVLAVGALGAVAALPAVVPAAARPTSRIAESRQVATVDAANLRLAARQVEAQALRSGALRGRVRSRAPAAVLYRADEALIAAAVRRHPGRHPADTRAVMGPVPYNLAHPVHRRPHHLPIHRTRTLRDFRRAIPIAGSAGVGHARWFRGVRPAPYLHPDGRYVDPHVPQPRPHATVAEVALRWALRRLGQPYVWGGAGPATFDCSGLVMRAYGAAGVPLVHYTGSQWNQGRLIPAREALPGDLVLFGHSLHHVAMYLGAGWMLNAPFTGHYVDVLPVWRHVAGVVRP